MDEFHPNLFDRTTNDQAMNVCERRSGLRLTSSNVRNCLSSNNF